jgi:hypothetical protein
MDYHGLWTIPKPLRAKAVTTAQRYGTGMAHPTPFGGHGLSWIIMDYVLSRIIVMILDYHGLRIIVDYR